MEEYTKTTVVQLSVDFGPAVGKVNFTVNEGEDFQQKMNAFARQYGISAPDAQKLEQSARSQACRHCTRPCARATS